MLSCTVFASERQPPSRTNSLVDTTSQRTVIKGASITPSAIPNGILTEVTVQATISGKDVLPNGVVVQQIDNQGRILKTFGNLKDDGISPDKIAGDGIFTGKFKIAESTPSSLRLMISAAVKNQTLRVTSETFFLNVNSEVGVINSDHTLWGGWDGGGASVSVYFTDPPPATVKLQLLRSPAGQGVWSIVQAMEYDATSFVLPVVDQPAGIEGPLDYEIRALDSNNAVLKTYPPFTVPKYIDEFPDSSLAPTVQR